MRMIGCQPVGIWWWGRSRTRGECVKDDMKLLGLQPKWAVFRDVWKDIINRANV